MQKYGTQNNIQRYKCLNCNKTFTFKQKLNAELIWCDYSVGITHSTIISR
ncbi:transposase-like zinc-binding domain-containing protein [Mannheimia indoligenes]